MKIHWQTSEVTLYHGDALSVLRQLPGESVNCCVTSPPYYALRDYGVKGQIGMESTAEAFIARLVEVFAEVRRVLTTDGTFWLNIGDSYSMSGKSGGHSGNKNYTSAAGGIQRNKVRKDSKPKDLLGIPWLLAFALRADGWYLRCDIIWAKPNPMPESVTDRPTKAHEYLFLLSKSPRYFYDYEAIKEDGISNRPDMAEKGIRTGTAYLQQGVTKSNHAKPDKQRGHSRRHAGFNDRWDTMTKAEQCATMRNKRSVWTIATHPFPDAHFATFPPKLVEPCILAGCPEGGTVLDPFAGSGTTLAVAVEHGRKAIGIELNKEYCAIAEKRVGKAVREERSRLPFPVIEPTQDLFQEPA